MGLGHQVKPKLTISKDIFRAYDIRGIYPNQLNEDSSFLIGKSIGTKVNATQIKKICVCMDGRLSSPKLKEYLIKGLISSGINVIDIGELPTPLLYFSLYHLNIHNGVMITGSHNPKDHNGLKVIINNKTLFGEHIKELMDLINDNNLISNQNNGVVEKNNKILEAYIDKIKSNIKIKNPMNVSLDCGNGVTGRVVRKIFDSLNISTNIINEKVDGEFPNHPPDPLKEKNLEQIKKNIIKYSTDIGFAYDGDGDRVNVIKKNGEILWPDQLLIIFARDILKRNAGSKIVFDIKCTSHLKDEIIKNKGVPILSRTGHSFIKNRIIEEKAILGGEMSGHIFFADKWDGFDDGIYASIRLLEILSFSNQPELLLDDLPKSISTPEINIPFKGNNHFTFMELFVKLAKFENAEIIDIDGLKIIYPDGWGLIRCSNTTSDIILRFEADTEETLNKIKKIIKDNILKVDKGINIPF